MVAGDQHDGNAIVVKLNNGLEHELIGFSAGELVIVDITRNQHAIDPFVVTDSDDLSQNCLELSPTGPALKQRTSKVPI